MAAEKERIAIPVVGGKLSAHFGHSEVFVVYDVENGRVVKKEEIIPPPHSPGVIPRWLNDVNATTILTGGIGAKAIEIFNSFGISVYAGAPVDTPEAIVEGYLKNNITFSGEQCNHDHGC